MAGFGDSDACYVIDEGRACFGLKKVAKGRVGHSDKTSDNTQADFVLVMCFYIAACFGDSSAFGGENGVTNVVFAADEGVSVGNG